MSKENKKGSSLLLSILVPTLKDRQHFFLNLQRQLNRQLVGPLKDKVEVLAYEDNRENTTGKKRNVLLNEAKGLFSVFVDDDDMLDPSYCALIIQTIESNPDIDCIGIGGVYSEDGIARKPFQTSLQFKWEDKPGRYERYINHISPIRTELARQVKFPNKTFGEDYDWTMELRSKGLLKKEALITKEIYYYNFRTRK